MLAKNAMILVLVILLGTSITETKRKKTSSNHARGTKNRAAQPFAIKSRLQTFQPIIGILAQEATGRIKREISGQYIKASYAKMIETAGARVVPVLINQSPQQIQNIFNSINGLLLPGGHVKLQKSGYGRVGKMLYEMAVKSNRQGQPFPIWAECLGLELIALLASGRGLARGQYDTELLDRTDSKIYSKPLNISKDYKQSQLLGSADSTMIQYMMRDLKAYNNHDKSLTPEKYNKYPSLKSAFRIVSTNNDRKGKEYISTMEGRKFPFFLFHWHPNKARFEQLENHPVHDPSHESFLIAQYLTKLFVDIARQNNHRFATTQKEKAALIQNYTPKKLEDGRLIYQFKM
ncbi:gamma-glutamyl hydrolase isoform X1 [Nematostella vectensis]|uniref:gamma-glutamyl hydrolase isoform X1 n=2 Tax=Nematostella vectensis TaxID=45351 RepID=UPI00207721B6|nr:gamma-glutamyl hydrolase isoform X1 [Nematostella vectensis]